MSNVNASDARACFSCSFIDARISASVRVGLGFAVALLFELFLPCTCIVAVQFMPHFD